MHLKCYRDKDSDLWTPVEMGGEYVCTLTGTQHPLQTLRKRWGPLTEVVLSDTPTPQSPQPTAKIEDELERVRYDRDLLREYIERLEATLDRVYAACDITLGACDAAAWIIPEDS
jgi:hypothetical protein